MFSELRFIEFDSAIQPLDVAKKKRLNKRKSAIRKTLQLQQNYFKINKYKELMP